MCKQGGGGELCEGEAKVGAEHNRCATQMDTMKQSARLARGAGQCQMRHSGRAAGGRAHALVLEHGRRG